MIAILWIIFIKGIDRKIDKKTVNFTILMFQLKDQQHLENSLPIIIC